MDGSSVPALPAVENGPGRAPDDRIERLLERAQKAFDVRLLWQPIFQDCYDYALPRRQGFYQQNEAQRRTDLLYDSTAVVALTEFASRLQAYVVPIYAKWADLVPGTQVPKQYLETVQEACDDVTNYIFAVLQNSNFDQQTNECFHELGLGTACLVIEDDDQPGSPVKFAALPLTDFTIESGVDGGTGAVFRERKVKWSELTVYWPDATIPAELEEKARQKPDDTITVLEATVRDYSFRGEELWDHSVLLKDEKKEIYGGLYRGAGSCPYVVFHWAKAPLETFGRGPVVNALPDIKVCNLVTEMVLENAELAIAGLWQADDDGVINPETLSLAPGTIIPRAMNSKGLEALQPACKFDVSNMIIADMRAAIKHALYDEPLGSMQDTRIQTAQEVVERMADLSRRIGSSFGRLQSEFVQPVLRRVVYLLRRQGRIKLPEVNGRAIGVRPVTPLARTQSQEEVLRLDRMCEILANRFGPNAVNTMVKGEQVAPWLAEHMGVPHALIRTPAEQQAILRQAAQEMAQSGAQPAEITNALK